MEEKITVKLEAKTEMSEVDQLKMKLLSLQIVLRDAKSVMRNAMSGEEFRAASNDALRYQNEIDKIKSKIKELSSENKRTSSSSSNMFKKMGTGLTDVTKKVGKYFMALLSIKSAYALLRKAASAYLSVDTELSDKIQSAWSGLGAILSPVIEYLGNLLTTAVSYINAFVKALTGIDYVAKMNEKALKNQKKATDSQTASIKKMKNATTGIDELNVIQQDESTGGGAETSTTKTATFTTEEIDTSKLEKMLTIWDTIKTVLGVVVSIIHTIIWLLGGTLAGIVLGLKEIFTGVFYGIYDIIWGVIQGIVSIIEGVVEGIKIIWQGLVDGIGLIIEGFKEGDWKKVWEGIKTIVVAIFKGIWRILKGIIEGILNLLLGIGAAIVNIILGIINGAIMLINGIIRGINKIKIPDWVPGVGGAHASIQEISKVPYIEVTPIKLATGGIVNKSVLANIGEAGKEGVVPLTNESAMRELGNIIGQYASNTNNNTQPVQVTSVLKVDGKTLARAVNKANYKSGASIVGGAFAL